MGSLQPQLVFAARLTLRRSHAEHLTAPHAGRRPRLLSSLVCTAKSAWPWAVPRAQWLRRSFPSLPAALEDPLRFQVIRGPPLMLPHISLLLSPPSLQPAAAQDPVTPDPRLSPQHPAPMLLPCKSSPALLPLPSTSASLSSVLFFIIKAGTPWKGPLSLEHTGEADTMGQGGVSPAGRREAHTNPPCHVHHPPQLLSPCCSFQLRLSLP